MEYLKLFESFNDKLYQEIDINQYQLELYGPEDSIESAKEFVYDNWEDFSLNEIDRIKKETSIGFTRYAYGEITLKTDMTYLESNTLNTTVIKLKDDWIYVIVDSKSLKYHINYFKCDQIEGLIDLLNYIKSDRY